MTGYTAECLRKGANGLAAARQFLREVYKQETVVVTNREENWKFGDLRLVRNNKHIEVKCQDIDPRRFGKNVVDACKPSVDPRKRERFANLAKWLQLEPEQLAQVPVKHRKTGRYAPFGTHQELEQSLASSSNAAWLMYINNDPVRGWVYLYDREEFADLVRPAICRELYFHKDAGGQDTYSVFIEYPRRIFTRKGDGPWQQVTLAEALQLED